ncbi:hypothetical protein SAMN05428950_1011356 [Sphingomonas sp. OV641]|uniref:hypothetical protein n=1 Tax=Sphingomonas sp. OV641 TaxID=1881068 RepID=UPI0008D026EE|nr:hypothetical protein [Sphingomonas sp. OV641]SEJ17465.1 hypothetical protein SAMN05428950_1011356 [Sphingomonas sp. OV641]
MTIRTAVLAIVASLLAGALVGASLATACAKPSRSDDPFLRARDYALSHYAKDFPKGTQLYYFGFEAGDVWLVELSDPQTIGGGSRFLVFRNSDRVEFAGRTQ